MSVQVVTESELRQCVTLDEALVDVVAEAFSALARNEAVMPPILSMDISERNAEVDIKTAFMRGFDSFAIKVSSGFFDNPKQGLPSLSGLMVVLDAETGQPSALLLDNGYLTDVRTAAAGAVAARLLARADAADAGVLGAGLQARLQMHALALVRPLRTIRIWARRAQQAQACATDLREALGVEVEVMDSAEAVVRESQVVVTTTPSGEPLIKADWLHPGLHITAMGSDAPGKNELEPRILVQADRVVVDRRSQSVRQGEMRAAIEQGAISEDEAVDELGELTAGQKPGREDDTAVTVADLTGTGVQDTAIANYALHRAGERGMGATIEA